MKNYLLVLFTFALLFGSNQEIKSQDCNSPNPSDKNTIIYLKISEEIPSDLPNNEAIYNYISICDNHSSQEANDKDQITNFTSDVYKSAGILTFKKRNKVTWNAIYNGTLDIKIKNIIPKGSGNIDYLTNERVSSSGDSLDFKLKRKRFPDSDNPYNIIITIDGNDYTIDPVMKYHP